MCVCMYISIVLQMRSLSLITSATIALVTTIHVRTYQTTVVLSSTCPKLVNDYIQCPLAVDITQYQSTRNSIHICGIYICVYACVLICYCIARLMLADSQHTCHNNRIKKGELLGLKFKHSSKRNIKHIITIFVRTKSINIQKGCSSQSLCAPPLIIAELVLPHSGNFQGV